MGTALEGAGYRIRAILAVNRRRLFLMSVGVLAAAVVAPFSRAEWSLGRDTVYTSPEAAAGIEELIKTGVPASIGSLFIRDDEAEADAFLALMAEVLLASRRKVSLADLFVSVDADVSGAITGLMAEGLE